MYSSAWITQWHSIAISASFPLLITMTTFILFLGDSFLPFFNSPIFPLHHSNIFTLVVMLGHKTASPALLLLLQYIAGWKHLLLRQLHERYATYFQANFSGDYNKSLSSSEIHFLSVPRVCLTSERDGFFSSRCFQNDVKECQQVCVDSLLGSRLLEGWKYPLL